MPSSGLTSEKKLDEATERLEITDELRKSGELGEMIDSGDLSNLPDELRPDHTD